MGGGEFVVHILQSSITFLNHALRMFYINSRSITEMKIMSRQESPRIYDLGGRIDFGISDKFGITGGRMTQGWIILSNNGWLHVFTSSENRIHLEPKGRRHKGIKRVVWRCYLEDCRDIDQNGFRYSQICQIWAGFAGISPFCDQKIKNVTVFEGFRAN